MWMGDGMISQSMDHWSLLRNQDSVTMVDKNLWTNHGETTKASDSWVEITSCYSHFDSLQVWFLEFSTSWWLWINGLTYGKIYREPLIFQWNVGFSCNFPLNQSIDWRWRPNVFTALPGLCSRPLEWSPTTSYQLMSPMQVFEQLPGGFIPVGWRENMRLKTWC